MTCRSPQSQSDYEGAAADLERALRIEPRNPVLWARLAEVRYDQQEWRKAVQMAAKSNTLINSDDSLRRRNWVLMGNAYEALGETENADKYRQKL